MAAGALPVLRRFFASWRFPTFMLSTLLLYYALLAGLVFWPPGDGVLARFAADFRVWCLAADPSTGEPSRMGTVALLGEPVALGLVVLAVWWRPLRELRVRPQRILPYSSAALVVVVLSVVMLGRLAAASPTGLASAEFPGAAMRTTVPAPELDLVDQDGAPVRLSALRGRVVLVTAVYASCGLACPMIFAQVRRALAALDARERDQVAVLAITLDPEHDDVAHLAALAQAQGVASPGFRLLTGAPARVDAVLDHFGVERHRDPQTGKIDHTNLFVAIDRDGRIAYRFGLGALQERWTVAALHQLVAEPAGTER